MPLVDHSTSEAILMTPLKILWHGLTCCEVVVNQSMQPKLFRQLGHAAERLRDTSTIDGAVSSYSSLAAYWKTPPDNPDRAAEHVAAITQECLVISDDRLRADSSSFEVPVRYDGPDLVAFADALDISPTEIVHKHTDASYTVAAIGFLPNFAYLWGLDPSIAAPRLPSPRTRVPVGAVGIAGNQTGVYPQETPGGWQLIGQADPELCRQVCPQLKIGDTVRFVATEQTSANRSSENS